MTILLMLLLVSCGTGAPGRGGGAAKTVAATPSELGAIVVDYVKGDAMDTTGATSLVLGGGCFWCLEAAYELVPGVIDVVSGYAGGSRNDPSYEQVSTGLTGHAEAVRIVFDPARVSYESLFELFFKIHDPTTEDRQGADIGSQYRSIILYADEGQRSLAAAAIEAARPGFERAIVTELEPLDRFWPAEEHHQDFFRKNPDYGYCRIVVRPKVDKAKSFVEALGPDMSP